MRWPDGCRCLSCASVNVEKVGGIKLTHRDGLLRCKDCRRQFTVTVGTVFHRSKVPLSKWLLVVHLENNAGLAKDTQAIAQAAELSHKTVQKMRARIYAALITYKGPNTVFGGRPTGYVWDQRPKSYRKPPEYKKNPGRYFAWRRRNPLGDTVEALGVLTASAGYARGGLNRTERLLRLLVSTDPVKLAETPERRGKANPSHTRWLPKQEETKGIELRRVRASRT
ncbi:hypothetical protein [Bradyrhizobium sp. CCGB01]|uniref:hypothetical protein n=1 Tax=Bradyrhizobium sp. CCGB01 TaxID=2949634 RepID=UPI0035C77DE9